MTRDWGTVWKTMCGEPPSSPVISSDSEKSFSSAVKRCICTWGGKGKPVTPRIPVFHTRETLMIRKRDRTYENILKIFQRNFPYWHHLSRPFGILYTESWIAQTPFLNSQLSTHFDFPRRSSSRLFRETVWQKACTIKSPMKDPLSFIGLFLLTPCRKARFRCQGAWRSLTPIRRVKNPVRAFPSYPGMLHIIFPWSPPLCPLPYTLCITAQASCYDTLMRIRYISFCSYHSMKKADESIHNSSVLCVTIYLFWSVP